MRIQKRNFEGLLDSWEARETFEWPEPFKCRIEDGWIKAEKSPWFAERPLEDPDFFLSFARLGNKGEPSENRILSWVRKYGPLKWARENRRSLGPEAASMHISRFREEVCRAHDLLGLYAQVRGRDLTGIRARFVDPNLPFHDELSGARRLRSLDYRGGEPLVKKGEWTREVLDSFRDELDLFISREFLCKTVTELIRDVHPTLTTTLSSSHAVPSYHCPNLLSALYFQFFLLVAERKPMRFCGNPACGAPLPTTRKDRKYCNASCRSNARHYR